jgi:hypothetical protein
VFRERGFRVGIKAETSRSGVIVEQASRDQSPDVLARGVRRPLGRWAVAYDSG